MLKKYNILIPPIDKNILDLTSFEAEAFFKWYINHIDQRVEYLQQKSKCKLDYTVDSCYKLWRWFLHNAEIIASSETQQTYICSQIKSLPYAIQRCILDESAKEFSLQTKYVLRDIGMYAGELLVKQSNKLYWSYHTDKELDSFANMPLVMGFFDTSFRPPFPMRFEPNHMIEVIASNLFDGSQKNEDLLALIEKWLKKVPDIT